jgi:hypothetical protein
VRYRSPGGRATSLVVIAMIGGPGLRDSVSVQPRTLLTADDIRSAGFRPEPGSETVDDQVAHVWYPSIRRGERWDIGLGVYGAPDAADAERYWDGLVGELGGGDLGVERVDVGDQAVHAEGWLYVRQRGQVLWIAVEGPDPVLARWAVERLARSVCPRVAELPPPGEDPSVLATESAPLAPDLSQEEVVDDPPPPAEPPPAPSPTAPVPEALDAGGPVLRPRATAPGRYRRRHLGTAGLTLLDGRLVVVDARGREHRFALDGTAGAPAAIGLTFDPRGAVTVAYLAVLDGEGRLLVRDGEPGAWAVDDIRLFAEATGLRYLEPEARVDPVDWHRQPVEMEGTPWVFMLLLAVAVVGAVALVAAGAPALAVLAAGVAVVAVGWLASRLAHVRVPPPD